MAQPQPPQTRQSGPQAKEADAAKELRKLKPGGPIMPSKQGFVNPGPTDNLRGVEPNTAMHRGTPNPEQHGTHKNREDHNPGMAQAGDVHRPRVPEVMPKGKTAEHSTKVAPPEPDPRGVRK